jgi:hypothetical protein
MEQQLNKLLLERNTSLEGWTPELLGMALLAIDIALLDEKNWELYKRLHE